MPYRAHQSLYMTTSIMTKKHDSVNALSGSSIPLHRQQRRNDIMGRSVNALSGSSIPLQIIDSVMDETPLEEVSMPYRAHQSLYGGSRAVVYRPRVRNVSMPYRAHQSLYYRIRKEREDVRLSKKVSMPYRAHQSLYKK